MISLVCFCSLLALSSLTIRAEREFTSVDGKKLAAELVSATDTEVTLLRTKDQKEFTLPLSRLSAEDQDFIRNWLAALKVNTREARELELSLSDGTTKKVAVPEGLYLDQEGVLTLYPGDIVHLEFDDQGAPKVVSKVENANRTVTFKMSQSEKITMVNRTTKMKETVALDCTHRGLGDDDFHRTNLHPTANGLASFDSWPSSVWTVKMSNFEVTDKPASEVYEERISK